MKIEKMPEDGLDRTAGGNGAEISEESSIIFKNICTICGKTWEYKIEKGEKAIPEWATGPLCPKCLRGKNEEFFNK